MKLLLVVVVVAFMAISVVSSEETYTSKFDNVNIDEILESDRLFNNYYKCLINTGKCTADVRELKKLLPDALKTGCSKCSEKQKKSAEKVINFMIEKKKPEWDVLQSIYDPEGVYLNKYRDEAKKHGINV